MISTGKHRAAMALGLVLVVSACGGGTDRQSGDGPIRSMVRGVGGIFGSHTADAPATQTAPADATAANPASQTAPETVTSKTATNASALTSQTPAGDPAVYETEAVAGSGTFRGLLRNIFSSGKKDSTPAASPEAASAPRTAVGQAATTQTVATAQTVANPVYAPTYTSAQPERRGLFNGYFRNLFKPDNAPDTAQIGGPIGGTFGRNIDPEVTLRVNRYIWTAALDVLSFLPLETVDPFSGVFVTGYGTPPGGGRAYRATVYVQDPALDARSLNLALDSKGGGPVTLETTRAVENAILTRARQLRIAETNR